MDALRKHLSTLIATFFYAGYSPKAPGTIGSLAALPFAWYLWQLPGLYAWSIFNFTLALGVWASHEVVLRTGVQDNQCIVIDEVLGIFLTTSLYTLLPNFRGNKSEVERAALIFLFFLAFLAFRLFDIWKPGPIRWVDKKIKGGLGVVVDDLIAALFAILSLLLIFTAMNFYLSHRAT